MLRSVSDETIIMLPQTNEPSATPQDNEHQPPCSSPDTKSTKPSASYPHWHDLVAGAAAGLGARALTAPLDLIKIRRQLESSSNGSSHHTVRNKGSVLSTAHSFVDGEWKLIHHLRSIAEREGGIRSLFRGNVAASYLWMGYSVVQFWVYGYSSEYLRWYYHSIRSNGNVTPSRHLDHDIRTTSIIGFASGAIAGICGTLLTYPFDLCRTVFAARGIFPIAASNVTWSRHTTILAKESQRKYLERRAPKTLREFSRQLYEQKGVRGFFAGSSPAILSIIPYMGLNFALHDVFVSLNRDPSEENSSGRGSVVSGVAGMGAGVISKFLVYPLDTVKKRLQAQAFWGSGVSEMRNTNFNSLLAQHRSSEVMNVPHQKKAMPVVYEGMIDCFIQILRREGSAAFYKGLIPSLLKSSVSTGASFWLFAFSKNVLRSVHDSMHD
ncbi:hypothetical protein HJC23_008724 [Cyclotella cryptica]|uniref:Mitochondrial carrier protein n=1 Tax=Cyclotella cryptica TaxID=29204 RepID=A0ABD3PEE4_9STRA|eukprot:CCRYP_015811-RA/>CCRYP_015811-RA protein AED:0.29 eAED:0.29 QI:0/-1/0/1/-1/1/1/0/437